MINTRIYLDNAATTPLDERVVDAMVPFMKNHFGNPSSIHAHGREVRTAIEKARKTIAHLLNTSPAEIFFTSGGTEADNFALMSSIETHAIKHAITSPLEHHAVLHTLEHAEKQGKIKLSLLSVDSKGNIDINELEQLLKKQPKTIVSLMHANNEIGNLYDINTIAEICHTHQAIYHSDTVQTMAHFTHNLQTLKADFIVGAAHKFHGPKGVGFLYINNQTRIAPLIYGGAQERNMRGGTENIYGIIGMAKALEIAYEEMQEHHSYIEKLKQRMITQLQENIPNIGFNGLSNDLTKSNYIVLNVSLPPSENNDMLLFNLDINKISASGGSACSSGSQVGSHVLRALKTDPQRGAIRFSFSKYNTPEEIDYTVQKLIEICEIKQTA